MLDIFSEMVCTIVFGNSWCTVGCKTGLPTPPADILAAALTWLGRLHMGKIAVKTQKTGKPGQLL